VATSATKMATIRRTNAASVMRILPMSIAQAML
jgi:hypothetical protein